MKGKICIVDHDLANRGYLRECLEKEGHFVTSLENGLPIKSHLSQEIFDIIRYVAKKKSGSGMAVAFLVVLAVVCVALVAVLVYVLTTVK